ncbi:alpha/beta hydrolase fold domain-containing protein [uncultured Roseovarius sp.]|uniref:alpha/beta hydrolase n=1 Tax=uncultured Roseovarius sp. TaxID=293344 RepID=UPI002638ED60|nr:alpha/beta hydrolase fold domain-containing protein [uncultured Roseovarius sp.]
MAARFAPSDKARAFLADPANRITWDFNAEELPAMRASDRAEAEKRAPRLAEQHGVTLGWQDIAGVPSLLITPEKRCGDDQVLYLFGGSFIMGGPLEDLVISATLAGQSDMQVISPAYALAPEAPFPAGLNDVLKVARHVQPRAVVGESAGGNFALSVARQLVDDGAGIAALALLSPAADMSPAFDPDDAADDPTLYPPLVATMPGIYAPETDPFDDRLSPLYGNFGPDWPPCLITTGTRDRFAGPCARLARAMREAGAEVDLRLWDGMWHVFEYYEGIPESAASLREIAAFLSAHCRTER